MFCLRFLPAVIPFDILLPKARSVKQNPERLDRKAGSKYNQHSYFFKNITTQERHDNTAMKKKNAETRQPAEAPVTTRVKLMICTEERFFGPGVCELMEKIQETGSIQAAAARMELSYTKAWKILNRAEQHMGTNLITRTSGGKNGGSSTLTEAGKAAVSQFREMEEKVSAYAAELLKTHWHPIGEEEDP